MDTLLIGIAPYAHSLEVTKISQCSQCNLKIPQNLAETITAQQMKLAPDTENARLLCIACFCVNGCSFTTPEHLVSEPLPVRLTDFTEEKESDRTEKRIDRKRKAIKTRSSTSVPSFATIQRTIRWEISKSGRIGKPTGGKNSEGANTYLCPICDIPVERKHNFPGRSLDDVAHHLEVSGCYDKFLAEEEA